MRRDFVPGKWSRFLARFPSWAVEFADANKRLRTVCELVEGMRLVRAMYNAIDRRLLEMGSWDVGAVEKTFQVTDKADQVHSWS